MNNQNQSMEDAIAEALAAVDSHVDTPEMTTETSTQDESEAGTVADPTNEQKAEANGSMDNVVADPASAPEPEVETKPAPANDDGQSQKALEELKTRHMRLMADFDNYRKRVQREQATQRLYASENSMRDLLGVVDNIERALSVSSGDDIAGSMAEGVRMILNQMMSVLERHGVKPFDSIGETFDPERHEAVARQGHDVYDEDLVCEQMQKGYMLHDRLLRAASVVVSAGKLDRVTGSASNGGEAPEAKS